MDIDTFRQRVLQWTTEQLEQVLENAREKGLTDYAAVVSEELARRHPLRRPKDSRPAGASRRPRAQGSRLTKARIGKESRTFDTANEAFAWLFERMLERSQRPVEELISPKHGLHFGGVRRTWIARTPEALYHSAIHISRDPNMYVRLSNGWYLDLNSSNEQKRNILFALAFQVGIDTIFGYGFDAA
jgi:hypothetical protein